MKRHTIVSIKIIEVFIKYNTNSLFTINDVHAIKSCTIEAGTPTVPITVTLLCWQQPSHSAANAS